MSSKKRSRIKFKDERIEDLVNSWTSKLNWQIEDFAIFLSLINITEPVELSSYDETSVTTIVCHEVESGKNVLIQLSDGDNADKPSTITVVGHHMAEIYETNSHTELESTPKVDLRCVTLNDGVKKTVFLFYNGLPVAIKSIEGKEEVSFSKLTNKWEYKDGKIEIVFNLTTQRYTIVLTGDEEKLERTDLLEMIRNARSKVTSLMNLSF